MVTGDAGYLRSAYVNAAHKDHDRRYALDGTVSRRERGWSPTVDFDQGLAATGRWYRDNRAWWTPLKRPR
ncbi:hypothetical protein ONA70_23130 [Micromonospora yasonensis]|nr:hypothetical protein [Micromonospora yasonensis]